MTQAVLLLNENQSINTIDKKIIRDTCKAQVIPMTSGVVAAKHLAKHPNSLSETLAVVVGDQLADMTGEQFCRLLRMHPSLQNIPILRIVGCETQKDQIQMLGTQASALLARPFSVDTMRKALHDITVQPQAQAQSDTESNAERFYAYLDNYETLMKPIRHDPEDFYKVGMQCLQQKKWNSAIQAFEHARNSATLKGEAELGLAAAYTGKRDQRQVEQWLALAAETMVTAGRWDIARAIFARVTVTNAQARNPFFLQARKLISQGDYAKAAHTLAEGLETVPTYNLCEKMAELCSLARNPDNMLALLEKAIQDHGQDTNDIRKDLRICFERKVLENRDRTLRASEMRKEELSKRLQETKDKKENNAKIEQDPESEKKEQEQNDEFLLTESNAPTNPTDLGLLSLPGDLPKTKKSHDVEAISPQHRSGLFGDIAQIIKLTWHLMRHQS